MRLERAAPCADKGLHVLGKAGAAVVYVRIDELVADAVVRTDAPTHFAYIGSDLLADVGDFVDKLIISSLKG